MDNDKKMIIDGVSVIDASSNDLEKFNDLNNRERNADQQRLMKKKSRIIIVSLVILAILICILVAAIVLFSLWTTGVQFQEKKHRTIGNREIDEELYQDKVDRLSSYHVQDNGLESWLILDYNRELEIMKVKNGASATCYVSIRDPSNIQEKNQTETNGIQKTTPGSVANQRNESLPVVVLRPSNRPILEKSMLGTKGQQLCQDVDTFWILSSCSSSGGGGGGDGTVASSRVRRDTWQIYSCYWDLSRCMYYTFPDNPLTLYYRCLFTCGFQTYTY